MDIQQQIKEELKRIFEELQAPLEDSEILITASDSRAHGDYTTNIAMKKAKALKNSPLNIGEQIKEKFALEGVEKVEVVKPGFINFFLKADELGKVIQTIISEGDNYGQNDLGKGKRVNIEYVSANPTGKLHLGHARGAALGDCLARLYKKSGYEVTREYYVNDAGVQMDHLAESLLVRYLNAFGIERAMPEDGYHGEEIIALANELKDEIGDEYLNNPEEHLNDFKKYGGDKLLEAIKTDLKEFRVEHDVYTSEKAIREKGEVEAVLEKLKPYCYKKDGAVFLNTTKDGDDKDRVLIKTDGNYTYLLPDIAYHDDKFNRGYDLLIDLFGADHHGYIQRLKSSQKDLGHNPSNLLVTLVQMVRLFKDGEEFKMSKRTGNAITMQELIEEVGVDSVRYFFVSRSGTSHLDFDIDLAKTLGNENPVYYAQYTHARLCGILRNAKNLPVNQNSSLLNDEKEKDLLLLLKDFTNVIITATKENEPYKITNYIHSLAQSVNEFYTKCRVIDESNPELTSQRLGLVKACQIVLSNALSLIAVTAPSKMTSEEKETK